MSVENYTTPDCERVCVRICERYVDDLPARDGKAAGRRACLDLKFKREGDSKWTHIKDRFYVPPDPERPKEDFMRWESVWRAAGLNPSKDGDLKPLLGQLVTVEITSGEAPRVHAYLPKQMLPT